MDRVVDLFLVYRMLKTLFIVLSRIQTNKNTFKSQVRQLYINTGFTDE